MQLRIGGAKTHPTQSLAWFGGDGGELATATDQRGEEEEEEEGSSSRRDREREEEDRWRLWWCAATAGDLV